MKIDDGGAAFGHGAENGHCCGMTIRDYFAGQCLMGLMNNAEKRIEVDLSDRTNGEILAANCYFMADCMIAQKNKV